MLFEYWALQIILIEKSMYLKKLKWDKCELGGPFFVWNTLNNLNKTTTLVLDRFYQTLVNISEKKT